MTSPHIWGMMLLLGIIFFGLIQLIFNGLWGLCFHLIVVSLVQSWCIDQGRKEGWL